ncbi:hypothetical protein B0E33_30570 (plasmid) [Roseibium algicola]|jgi:hypothetical protein|uniref:Uncharacterized protein n=1 Tax=Roseibium algicola TaxID=2857014 RepID=A0ABM6IC91_9HYPH|nr:hypothetical protein ACP90_27550 [Labrenzia sp. CP4]AQQ08169.1 hypothetical protein B0E33_30570 [Roseibium aggregatum]QFT01919.1 hypothetical protein FIV06_31080 [Labrenzia sp. THAF191b]QFT07672.1 hypothetical protein FIV05_28270 [Labrenzia sp. THAF191a]QFT19775.1 hypothetical protein FIV03_31085 [Labrenzia sp. THAF187b]QFT71400.1 hypothetical protein FIU93_31705 [Labrenzia sp. THAF35]
MGPIRKVKVYDIDSGLGGTHTVSIVEELPNNRISVRVWYGRATPTGWEAWIEWDGATFETTHDQLTNPRVLALYKEET